MQQSFFLKSLLFFGLLWMCAISSAQTPAPDLDSITEDSYRRMLERQEAQQNPDTLMINESQPAIPEEKSKDFPRWYYLTGILAIVAIYLGLSYYRRTNKNNRNLKF